MRLYPPFYFPHFLQGSSYFVTYLHGLLPLQLTLVANLAPGCPNGTLVSVKNRDIGPKPTDLRNSGM